MKIELADIRKQLAVCGLRINPHPWGWDQPWYVGIHHIVGVHHIHDWDHGYDEYGFEPRCRYNGTRRQFYSDMNEMTSFLQKYIVKKSISEFIVAPFHMIRQFECIDNDCEIYREVKQFLKSFDIRGGSQAGVKLSVKETDVIEMVIESAFRGVSFLSILFFEANVLVSPNHHFGMAFHTQSPNEEKEIIQLLLKDFPNIKFYERGISD